jgi:thiamine-phosphate pyrophosphorylase
VSFESGHALQWPLLLYYITDRKQFFGDEATQRAALLEKIAEAARAAVDFIQLREKDLSGRGLELLAGEAVRAVRENSLPAQGRSTRIVINSRTDVAIACGADGVHLPSDDITPVEARSIWSQVAGGFDRERFDPLISVSCHSVKDVARAASEGANFAIFAPVFEKQGAADAHPAGAEGLRVACQQPIPVLALGGITLGNAETCMQAGADGIAAIRLFQENEIAEVVRRLRG